MRTEIFIEKYKVDLDSSVTTRVNKSINDIRNLTTKNTSFTRTIKLPGTAENKKIFGHIFSDGREHAHNAAAKNVGYNYNPARSAKCVIYNDSFIAVRGVIRLLNVIRSRESIYFECVVYGELGGFVAQLGERLLSDLDFSAYNQAWTTTNITGSWNTMGTTGAGPAYPLIDYGLCSFDKVNFNVNAFRPAFPAKEYVDKIFAATGYTYDCPFFNSAFFKRLYIPHNEDNLYKIVNQLLNRTNNTAVNSWLTDTVNYNTIVKVPLPTGTMANFSTNAQFDEFTYTGSLTAAASLTYHINAEFRAQNVPTQYTVTFRVLVNGVAVGWHQVVLLGENPPTVWHPINLGQTVNVTINPGDVVKIDAITNTNPFTPTPIAFWINFKSADLKLDLIGAQAAPADYGDTLQMNNCIPKGIRQYDLIDSIINGFNLHITEDKHIEKRLIIRPYPLFYQTSIASRVAWSEKIDRAEDISFTPMSELTSRQINFQYDKDSDYWNEVYQKRRGRNYGDRNIQTGYEFGQDEKNIKLLFASSPLVGQGAVDKIVTTAYKLDSNGEQRFGTKIRLLQVKKITVPSYVITNWGNTAIGTIETNTTSTSVTGTGTSFTTQAAVNDAIVVNGHFIGTIQAIGSNTSITLHLNAKRAVSGETFYVVKPLLITTSYGYAGHLDDPKTPTVDLNFDKPAEVFYTLTNPYPSNNLYTAYWEHFLNEILNNRSALMTCFVNLKASDMYNIDFSKYIHVDGSYYRLNKIIDYDSEGHQSTKVELLKVIKPLT